MVTIDGNVSALPPLSLKKNKEKDMKRVMTLAFSCLLSLTMFAQQRGDVMEQSDGYVWPTDQKVLDKLGKWQDLKFGVLFHWGLYSVPGMVESWAICDEGWITRDTTQTYQQYKDWYWGLAKKFNPTKFDPTQWARVTKDAGMKYMIFTTKHHDGFCMFDSKYDDFSIANYAFKQNPKRDVLKYVLQAFRDQGFMLGTYFSKPDWHSQDYWWDVYPTKRGRNVNYDIKKWPWRWNRYKQFVYNQMCEITDPRRYGNVDILWLDGGWVCKENNQDIDMPRIAEGVRRNQPGLLIVDRTIGGPYENYQTPEQTIPAKQLSHPWESCITLTNDWGWVPRPTWKSPEKVISTLMEVVAVKQWVLGTRIQFLATPRPDLRIVELLTRLATLYGVEDKDGIRIRTPLTHEQVAALTGTSRVTVTRTIMKLKSEGVILNEGRRFWMRCKNLDKPLELRHAA